MNVRPFKREALPPCRCVYVHADHPKCPLHGNPEHRATPVTPEAGFLVEHEGHEVQVYLEPTEAAPGEIATFAVRKGIGHETDLTLYNIGVTAAFVLDEAEEEA